MKNMKVGFSFTLSPLMSLVSGSLTSMILERLYISIYLPIGPFFFNTNWRSYLGQRFHIQCDLRPSFESPVRMLAW